MSCRTATWPPRLPDFRPPVASIRLWLPRSWRRSAWLECDRQQWGWPVKNSGARRAFGNISKKLRSTESNYTALAITATFRSKPWPPPSLRSTAIAAAWVQAIWITREHSTSSCGSAPSMKARLAFTAVSEIPSNGSRAAAISCCSEASTNSLEAAPKAFFNLCHHSRAPRFRQAVGLAQPRWLCRKDQSWSCTLVAATPVRIMFMASPPTRAEQRRARPPAGPAQACRRSRAYGCR